jgi:phosphoenolpyruvate synthase/pyruvate phosphate dikinase
MHVVSLDDSTARDSRVAGNKAAVLARLAGRGYVIPPGAVVPPTALMNGDPVADIVSAIENLGVRSPWAVRSSSTAEDGVGSAFPGIFRTVLGVRSGEELVQAVDQVRESLAADQVQRYAVSRGLEQSSFAMSVLVQSQLSPRAAGVAFSRDPVTGEDVVGVEANYGLGESVVDGSATPDYFLVNRQREIIERETGTKRVQVVLGAGGLQRLEVSEADRARPAITDEEVLEIADLTWRLEDDLGCPQDVEWAIEDATLFLLQARPITTGEAE